jgi:dihydropteroate synthase
MQLRCGSRILSLDEPRVMGVLNVTPDSFSDGGRFADPATAVASAIRMVEEGAAIVDVGGESTRPGAAPVAIDEELRRVVPVIERLRARIAVPISIDTRRAQVMRAALAAGADMVNDVNALREPEAIGVLAGSGAAICLMHMLGDPRTMQQAPHYGNVVTEVRDFLAARVAACRAAGIGAERIAIDPGIGFGKTLEHNLELVSRLGDLSGLGRPIVIGVSRKATVGAITGRPVGERLAGSLALATLAAWNGAAIIRAHDVAGTVDALKVVTAVKESGR